MPTDGLQFRTEASVPWWLLCNMRHPICILSVLYPVSVQQLKITTLVLQHASFLFSYGAEYLSSIFLGFLSLPVSALKKNVFALNWFSSSFPIYTSPLRAEAGKHSHTHTHTALPTHKWVTQLLAHKKHQPCVQPMKSRFFTAVRCGGSCLSSPPPPVMVVFPCWYQNSENKLLFLYIYERPYEKASLV